jgi:XTP/dITP diphosphohydrolase
MRLRFLSSNPHKIAEARAILSAAGFDLIAVEKKLDEIQSDDVELLVRDKCIKAFRLIGRPVFVEHTGLYIEALNGFPGGLTQIFWARLGAERVAQLFAREDDGRAFARTRIGYCDGRCVHQFEGEVSGRLVSEPRGDPSQWDCVFIPEGSDRTLAEMGERKNDVSMRRKALDQLAAFLSEADHDR